MNNLPVVFFDPSLHPIKAPDEAYIWKKGVVWGISPGCPFDSLSLIFNQSLSKKGLILLDFYAPDMEWESIRALDILSARLNFPIHHVSWGGYEPLAAARKWQPIGQELDTYATLAADLNAETWMLFAKEIDQRSRAILKRMAIESTDEYTLEGELASFHQEVTSYLMSERLRTLQALKKEIGKGEGDPFSLEKGIVSARRALAANALDLVPLMEQALATIQQIPAHLEEWSNLEMALRSLHALCTKGGNQNQALYRLAHYLSLDLVILGNWDHKTVQNFLHSIASL